MPTTYPVRRIKPKPGDYVRLNGGERYAIISEMGDGNGAKVGYHLQSIETGHLTSIRAKSLMVDGNMFEDNSSDIPLF